MPNPSLFVADDCANYNGEFFEDIIQNPHLPLPTWEISIVHIDRVYKQLHANFITRVNCFFHFKCPFNCVPLRRRYFEEDALYKKRTHNATVDYFLAVCDHLEMKLEKFSKNHKPLQPLYRELPRLRILLRVIQRIVRPWQTVKHVESGVENVEEKNEVNNEEIVSSTEPESFLDSLLTTIPSPSLPSSSPICNPNPSPNCPPFRWEIDIAWKPFAVAPMQKQSARTERVARENPVDSAEVFDLVWSIGHADWKGLGFRKDSTFIDPKDLLGLKYDEDDAADAQKDCHTGAEKEEAMNRIIDEMKFDVEMIRELW